MTTGSIKQAQKTEIIAFCSGKGGTGKTLTCSCLGYALIRGGQTVLMIDADPGTDGLSLFLLGRDGTRQVRSIQSENTFVGGLLNFQKGRPNPFLPYLIHRRDEGHNASYSAVISGKGLYGEMEEWAVQAAVPDLDRATFRQAIKYQFDLLRTSGQFSYVLIDTRGGFALESTDVCALADSFIVVTEPDFTSFYQDRNLVARISLAAKELNSPSLLRGIIVNKATDLLHREDKSYLDNLEVSFRNELAAEFKVDFHETYPVPLDMDAVLAYKQQKVPYLTAPGSSFSFATLEAFSNIVGTVTSQWSKELVDQWNQLVDIVVKAYNEKRLQEEEKEKQAVAHAEEQEEMRARLKADLVTITSLKQEINQQRQLFDSERQRSDLLFQRLSPPSQAQGDVIEPTEAPRRAFSKYSLYLFGLSLGAAALIAAVLYTTSQDSKEAAANQEAQVQMLQQQLKDLQGRFPTESNPQPQSTSSVRPNSSLPQRSKGVSTQTESDATLSEKNSGCRASLQFTTENGKLPPDLEARVKNTFLKKVCDLADANFNRPSTSIAFKVRFEILTDGSVANDSIQQSSGNPQFDDAVSRAIKEATFPALTDQDKLTSTINVEIQLSYSAYSGKPTPQS